MDEIEKKDEQNFVVAEPGDELEALRSAFSKDYKRYRLYNYISFAIVISIIVVAYIFIFPLETYGMWAAIIIIIFTLGGSSFVSRKSRKVITARVRSYMSDYNGEINKKAIGDSEVSNYVYDFAGLIPSEDFINARVLKDVVSTQSRNLMTYEVGDLKVAVSDFVAYRNEGKQNKSVFLGKLVSASSHHNIDGRIVLYLKPDPSVFKETKGPDDVDDLELLNDDPRYLLYGTNLGILKHLPDKALDALLEIQTSIELADVALVMYENKFIITLSYSDKLMVIPFKEAIPYDSIDAFCGHLSAINKFFTLL